MQLLLALQYVHGYRVLHRDIALKNVFLTGDGTVKLGDFGVARILSSSQELAVTKVGTPCYIAPERVRQAVLLRGRRLEHGLPPL